MNNPPIAIRIEPSPGSGIDDCYDHALPIARVLNVVVVFDFNEVHCGVRPCDFGEIGARDIFLRNFERELAKHSGCKICYANP